MRETNDMINKGSQSCNVASLQPATSPTARIIKTLDHISKLSHDILSREITTANIIIGAQPSSETRADGTAPGDGFLKELQSELNRIEIILREVYEQQARIKEALSF